MKQFIELLRVGYKGKIEKVLLNTNHIFMIEPIEGNDKMAKCRILLSPNGFNDYPFQFIETIDTYEDVVKLIQGVQ